MTKDEIKRVLSDLINDYLDEDKDANEIFNLLMRKLNANEIYDINDFFITDCYFAIKQLLEDGYETTKQELQYFRKCFSGSRKYDNNEKMSSFYVKR